MQIAKQKTTTIAETQTAGYGLAQANVVQRLVASFDPSEPSITLRLEVHREGDEFYNEKPETQTREEVTITPESQTEVKKVEIGTNHGKDRVCIDHRTHAQRVDVKHQRKERSEWVTQTIWELHTVTGITQHGGDIMTDGGQTVQSGLHSHTDESPSPIAWYYEVAEFKIDHETGIESQLREWNPLVVSEKPSPRNWNTTTGKAVSTEYRFRNVTPLIGAEGNQETVDRPILAFKYRYSPKLTDQDITTSYSIQDPGTGERVHTRVPLVPHPDADNIELTDTVHHDTKDPDKIAEVDAQSVDIRKTGKCDGYEIIIHRNKQPDLHFDSDCPKSLIDQLKHTGDIED